MNIDFPPRLVRTVGALFCNLLQRIGNISQIASNCVQYGIDILVHLSHLAFAAIVHAVLSSAFSFIFDLTKNIIILLPLTLNHVLQSGSHTASVPDAA